jgi:hypothetical protein
MVDGVRTFDPVGAFQRGRRGQQLIAAEEAAAPRRNQLAELGIQQAQQTLGAGQATQERQATQFDQSQALQRATVLGQSAQALRGLPLGQRDSAFAAISPQLQQFDIDPAQFPPGSFTDENLDSVIAQSQSFIGSGGDESILTAGQREFESLTQDLPEEEVQRARRIKLKLEAPVTAESTPDVLREREIALKESEAARRNLKLSAGLEGALLKSQDLVVQSQRDSNEFEILANQFRDRPKQLEGGVKSTFSEFIKAALGTQDDVTEFRRKFNKVRLSEGLKNLPPGPATDRDVQEAFRGVPKENAGPEQIESFLRGAARLARLDAAFNQFKSDFISGNSTAKGMNKAWRQSFDSPVLGRKVSNVEIYETAQNRSVTPEDVKKQLGL